MTFYHRKTLRATGPDLWGRVSAACNIEGTIESKTKSSPVSFPWSHPLLSAGKYEEFGFPVPESANHEGRFRLEKIRENIVEVHARFEYRSLRGENYKLDYSIPIEKITNDWVSSKMLVTQDHPDRIVPRIAKTLERIREELAKMHN